MYNFLFSLAFNFLLSFLMGNSSESAENSTNPEEMQCLHQAFKLLCF